jgi:hypothetical protein
MRTIVCLFLCLVCAAPAEAARRWRSSCYVRPSYTYPQTTYQRKGVAEILGEVADRKVAYDALLDGLAAIFPQQLGYGGGPASAYSQYTETYGPQGSTVHGYQLQHGGFGLLDVMAAYDKADRWANNQLAVTAQAGKQLADIVQIGVDGQVRSAEVLARGQAAAAALSAAAGQPPQPLSRSLTLELHQDASGQWQVGSPPADGAPVQALAGPDPRLAMLRVAQQSANARCLKCHQGPEAKGNLNLSNLAVLTPDIWHKEGGILDRLTTTDAKRRMPRGADGAGLTLPAGEVRFWVLGAPSEESRAE